MEEEEIVRALSALGQPLRLKIFRSLIVAGKGGLTPGSLCEALSIPAATLSFHLKELNAAGLATQQRASRHIVYRADYERMNALLGYLSENCCQGEACAATPAAMCE